MQQIIHSGQVNGLLRKGVDFFYQNNATSPNKALTLSDGDWLYAFGESVKNRQRMLSFLTYIKITDDNKYWLDMEEYERFLENTKQKGNRMGIAIITIMIVAIFLVLYLTI